MRFLTIWTIPAMSFPERLRRTRDWTAMAIARRLPLRIRYWVTIQMMGHAARNAPQVDAMPLGEIMRNMDAPKVVA